MNVFKLLIFTEMTTINMHQHHQVNVVEDRAHTQQASMAWLGEFSRQILLWKKLCWAAQDLK